MHFSAKKHFVEKEKGPAAIGLFSKEEEHLTKHDVYFKTNFIEEEKQKPVAIELAANKLFYKNNSSYTTNTFID